MYNSSLTVTFPLSAFTFPEGRTASNQISVSALGVSYSVVPITSAGVLVVNLTRINKDQKVTITLKEATVATVGTQVSATTTMPGSTDTPVTRLTGGAFAAVEGSGTLTVSPDNAKANATLSRITVTYTAATELTDVTLVITVPSGITWTGNVSPSPASYLNRGFTGDNPSVNGNVITWSQVSVPKGRSFNTVITNVSVPSTVQILEFTAQQGGAALAAPFNFYVVNPEEASVTFTANTSSVSAASLQEIVFTFTAVDTPIGRGEVQFSIPSGWDRPVKTKDNVLGAVTVGGDGGVDHDRDLRVSGSSITVAVESLAVGQTVTVTYGHTSKRAKVQNNAGLVKIDGFYRVSESSSRIRAGTVEIDVTNAESGTGTGTVRPTTAKGGSIDGTFTIVYEAAGTMDGGRISLQHPSGWGSFETDSAKLNYISVRPSGGVTIEETDNGGSIIIVTLGKCPPRSRVTFTYGAGTGANRGARVQDATGIATFTIQSQGEDGGLVDVTGTRKKGAVTADNPDYLGETFTDAAGELRVNVTGADDGTGTATVDIVKSKQGAVEYTAENGVDLTAPEMRVHAADDGTYIKFVYTPTETIENGALRFTVPNGWSEPQGSDLGAAGFTSIQAGGGVRLEAEAFADLSVEVPISLINVGETIEIHYGETAGDGGGAVVPAKSGTYAFRIETKGGNADTNAFRAIRGTVDGDRLEVRVYNQASGGGNASASVSDNKGDVGAGDADREVTVTYTAAGQISGGSLKLTVPPGWSHPTADNVEITSRAGTVSVSSALFDGMDVTVGGVSLRAGGTVTFVYSAAMTQPTAGSAKFNVAVDGGSGPGAGPMAVTPDPSDATTITVGDASPGSGSGEVVLQQAIVAGEGGHTLTFIYTAAGAITDRALDIRVAVPTGWSAPTDRVDAGAVGSFTVTHRKLTNGTLAQQTPAAAAVEKIGPFDRQMAARLKPGSSLAAGDQVVFNYENAAAPATVGASTFTMFYGQAQVANADLTVIVGSGKPATAIALTAPATHLVESTTPAGISVELQDEDGNAVPAEADTVVNLSSSSATGSFTVDGAAATSVTIAAGKTTATAGYGDSTEGAATITASSGTLTADTATITVTTRNLSITSANVAIADSEGVAKTVARDGDTITVTATANPNKTVTVTIETIFAAFVNMAESPAGTYTRSYTLAAGTPDGTYDITVALGALSESAGSVAVDNTAPTISATSASPATVANGDTVTISATVAGATSVMANVSLLDTAATASVSLTDADADGTYTGMHTISADNEAANGAQSITVTATDAAGNSSSDSTATVTLQNSISFTSTLPAGISLFHVPLDEEGLDTVGDLETKLGANVNLLITYDGSTWNSRSSGVAITASLGILVSTSAETTVTFEGRSWADTTVTLAAGSNLIGLPVNDARVTNASDISGLFAAGTVSSVIAASGGSFKAATAADDIAVAGDAAYLVIAAAAGSATLTGDGWSNGTANAAPIALVGYTVDNQTPALNVHGSIVDEITGLAKEGFRVKVKNLSTKSALSHITAEASDGYDMTFVDLADSYAARVGDVLEITADSPDPLIGVQPVRHIVTVADVKNSLIQLEDLIAYEIPAETELLRNYPNPFNPETWIPYHLSEDADVSLTIYDVNGALVRDIDVGHQTAAKYDSRSKAIYWDGRNRFGEQVASGIYFYSLSAGDFSATRKMVILK